MRDSLYKTNLLILNHWQITIQTNQKKVISIENEAGYNS